MSHKISEHFTWWEFRCPCCGRAVVCEALVDALEHLRILVGNVPVVVRSGFRCAVHNEAVGGSERSRHMIGDAADIGVAGYSGTALATIANMVPGFRNGGIGTYSTHLHVDVRGTRARWEG